MMAQPARGAATTMQLGETEEHVVFLKAISDIIDSIVNFEVLELAGHDPDCHIVFKSATHQRFFNIVLVDFLSLTGETSPRRITYMDALQAICKKGRFDEGNSIEP